MAEAAKWMIASIFMLADNLTHEVLIADVAENKWHSRGDSPVKASRQIVNYDDAFVGFG